MSGCSNSEQKSKLESAYDDYVNNHQDASINIKDLIKYLLAEALNVDTTNAYSDYKIEFIASGVEGIINDFYRFDNELSFSDMKEPILSIMMSIYGADITDECS